MSLSPLILPDIDQLHQAWISELSQYRAEFPDCGPYAIDALSWPARAEALKAYFCEGAFGYRVRSGSDDAGHLLCARRPMEWQATFALPRELWEIVSLFVACSHRRSGFASQMLSAVESAVAASDSPTLLAAVLADNIPARRVYEDAGFQPAWVTLIRFGQPFRQTIVDESSGAIRIRRHAADDIARLRPLWIELHHHHQSVARHLGPYVPDAESWTVIESVWRKSAQAGLLWVAWDNGIPTGLVSAAVHGQTDLLQFSDTWHTSGRIAETKFLIVSESSRGRGLGSKLMDVVEGELALRGITDHIIGAIYGNERAISFYQSRGLKPGLIEYLKQTGTHDKAAPARVF